MRGAMVPLGLLIGLQVIDVSVHVATGQVEVLRILANLVIGLGAVVSVRGAGAVGVMLVGSGLVYLLLNLVFLAQNGVVNPQTGSLRLPLFVFVVGSLLLLGWISRKLPRD